MAYTKALLYNSKNTEDQTLDFIGADLQSGLGLKLGTTGTATHERVAVLKDLGSLHASGSSEP